MNTPSTATPSTTRPANPGYKTRNGLTRIKRTILGAALASFLGVTIFASLGSAGSAHAYEHIIGLADDDGTMVEFYKNDDGSLFVWITTADGEESSYTFDDNPNPNDDSPSTGPMTKEAIIELIKKYGGEGLQAEQDFWGNSLGKSLTEQGGGLIPVHNPSDLGKVYEDGVGGGVGGFDPNGGGFIDQLRNNDAPGGQASGGQEKGEHSEDDFGTETPKTGMFEDDMPGPPELINPNPVGR